MDPGKNLIEGHMQVNSALKYYFLTELILVRTLKLIFLPFFLYLLCSISEMLQSSIKIIKIICNSLLQNMILNIANFPLIKSIIFLDFQQFLAKIIPLFCESGISFIVNRISSYHKRFWNGPESDPSCGRTVGRIDRVSKGHFIAAAALSATLPNRSRESDSPADSRLRKAAEQGENR